eukprot:4473966-Pyramimonas_sp.AAC.2
MSSLSRAHRQKLCRAWDRLTPVVDVVHLIVVTMRDLQAKIRLATMQQSNSTFVKNGSLQLCFLLRPARRTLDTCCTSITRATFFLTVSPYTPKTMSTKTCLECETFPDGYHATYR